MKKITLILCILLCALRSQAQNGLEGIVVEKFYVSDATDADGSIGTLPVGSITYRVWADLLPSYKFQALYGVPMHEL